MKTLILIGKFFLLFLLLSSCSGNKKENTAKSSDLLMISSDKNPSKKMLDAIDTYDFAHSIKNGLGETIGAYSVIKLPSEECTVENLEFWYFDYIKHSGLNYGIIQYSNKEGLGVWSTGNIVVDAKIHVEESGDIWAEATEDSHFLSIDSKNKKLIP